MRLEQLRYFLKVGTLASITRASEELYTLPQNISKAIKQMESELGVTLFHRFKNGMFLTEDGLTAFEIVTNIIREVDRLSATFDRMAPQNIVEKTATLRIAATPLISDLVVSILNIMANSGYKFSELQLSRIDIMEMNRCLIENKPQVLERFDCVFAAMDHEEFNKYRNALVNDYVGYLLWTDRVCLEVDQSDDLTAYSIIPVSVLEKLPIVTYNDNAVQDCFVEYVFKRRGIHLNIRYRIAGETGKHFAMMQQAYSILGSPTNELRQNTGKVLIPIEGNIQTDQWLLVPRSRANQQLLVDLRNILDDLFSLKVLF
ncbi:MAG: LysR family transcriptional regulator [Lachnospiraceae bacterium]|nr:LysR family transcriptional regulator [Lachnospiraceae bacterium]